MPLKVNLSQLDRGDNFTTITQGKYNPCSHTAMQCAGAFLVPFLLYLIFFFFPFYFLELSFCHGFHMLKHLDIIHHCKGFDNLNSVSFPSLYPIYSLDALLPYAKIHKHNSADFRSDLPRHQKREYSLPHKHHDGYE